VGGDNQPANLTVVRTLCDVLDEFRPDSPYVPHESLIQYVPDRPGHDRRYAMNIEKIKNELGWQPEQSLESGLMKTVEWYLAHPEWVEAIRKQADYQRWLERNYAERGEQA
jgi:dTDP-glucose 4,6-dehydratase